MVLVVSIILSKGFLLFGLERKRGGGNCGAVYIC